MSIPGTTSSESLAERARGAVGRRPSWNGLEWVYSSEGPSSFLLVSHLLGAWAVHTRRAGRWTGADSRFCGGWHDFDQTDVAAAIACFEAALELEPGHGPSELGLALVAGWLYTYDEQIVRLRALLEPAWWNGIFNVRVELAWALIRRGDPGDDAEALELLRDVRCYDPKWNEAMGITVTTLMGHGHLRQAHANAQAWCRNWLPYSVYYDPLTLANTWPTRGPMAWDGSRLNGRTLFIDGDFGLGDQVVAAGFIPWATRLGGQIILRVRRPLVPLFRATFGDQLLELFSLRSTPLHQFDTWTRTSHLSMLGLDGDAIPPTPSLRVDPERVEQWRARLGLNPDRLNVGLCWADEMTSRDDRVPGVLFHGIPHFRRAIPLDELAPRLAQVPNVRLYAVQHGPAREDLATLPDDVEIIDLGGQIRDLADTAAIVTLLDTFVSVDTATANLAGALGLDAYVLLPYSCDWRWGRTRAETTPWYPTLRLRRQERHGEWGPVVERVADELAMLVAQRSTA